MRRAAPRSLAPALDGLTSRLTPATRLARVQEVWERAAGPPVAAAARPASERDGVLTLICVASVWAHELDLMASELVSRLNVELGAEEILELRCRTG